MCQTRAVRTPLTWIAQAQEQQQVQIEDPNTLIQSLLVTLIGGGITIAVGYFLVKWLRNKPVTTSSPNREEQERAQREIADARLQGVLTLQFVFAPAAWQGIAQRVPAEGSGMDAVLGLARELRETREHWLYVAARGTILMGEDEAAAEANRVLGIFQTRASTSDYQGPGAMLLTVAVRAPFDYCEVMPGDVEGFETTLSRLYDMDSRGSCSFKLLWTEVAQDTLQDVVPGLVGASVQQPAVVV